MKQYRLSLWRRGLAVGLTFAVLSLAGAAAQSSNLLRNPDFAQIEGRKVASWLFSDWNLKDDPAQLENYEWGVRDGALFFATKEATQGQMWWQQTVDAIPGETVKMKAKVKSSIEDRKYGAPRVGVYFLGENDKWLGIQESTSIPFDTGGDWFAVEQTVSVPEDARKMGVRLGAMFDGSVDVSFQEVELGPEN